MAQPARTSDEMVAFRVANDALNDSAELKRMFQGDGYLFFREVLDRERVREVKEEFVQILKTQGVVEATADEPIWSGESTEQIDDDPLYRSSGYTGLMASQELQFVMDRAYGERAHIAPSVGIRYSVPNDAPYLTPAHQDHYFIRETDAFRMIWIPLMDLPVAAGGLTIAVGSNHLGLMEHPELEDTFSYAFKGRKQRGIALELIDLPWAISDYKIGDVLMFHSLAVHRALPNRSDRIRLSLNTLTHVDRLPKMWQAEHTILELREHREGLRALCDSEGLSEPVFEAISLEMMKRGADLDIELVRQLAREVTS